MEIGLVISGNLTGFSWFYSTPNVKTDPVYQSAAIDFDYRNYLTFLDGSNKAYILSFARNAYAISLTSRILDSFRRPGLLTVSLLLPRDYVVADCNNSNNAAYKLLNELNSSFFEKNFSGGMINQNLSVLMQDYYTQILSRYSMAQAKRPSKVNLNIDQTSAQKRIGYIQANENVMFNYLSNPYRQSYEQYHHVFLAGNAPQDIEEPPVEVVLYNVKITNDPKRLFGGVRLTDPVYRYPAKDGEEVDDKVFGYTYEQVLSGMASPVISAIEDNQTITVTYKYKKQTRRITFEFIENGKPLSALLVKPLLKIGGDEPVSLHTDSYEFIGDEIYKNVTLSSGAAGYRIKDGFVDVIRLREGDIFRANVEKAPEIRQYPLSFSANDSKPKTIRFSNIITNDTVLRENVLASTTVSLEGNANDWMVKMESPYYETEEKSFVDAQKSGFNCVPKYQQSYVERVQTSRTVNQTQSQVSSLSPNVTSRSTLRVSSETGMTGKKHRKRDFKKYIILSLSGLAILAALFVLVNFFISQSEITKKVSFIDDEKKEINEYRKPERKDVLSEITFNPDNSTITYKKESEGKVDKISFEISHTVKGLSRYDSKENKIKNDSTGEIKVISHKVTVKEGKDCVEVEFALSKTIKEAKDEALKLAEGAKEAAAKEAAAKEAAAKEAAAKKAAQEAAQEAAAKEAAAKEALKRADAWDVTLQELIKLEKNYKDYLTIKTKAYSLAKGECDVTYKDRIEGMKSVIKDLKNRAHKGSVNLSKDQYVMVKNLADKKWITTTENDKLRLPTSTELFSTANSIADCYEILKNQLGEKSFKSELLSGTKAAEIYNNKSKENQNDIDGEIHTDK